MLLNTLTSLHLGGERYVLLHCDSFFSYLIVKDFEKAI